MIPQKAFRVLKYLFFLGMGIGLLWLVTKDQDLGRLGKEMWNARFGWIFLSIVIALVSHVIRAARWNLLIHTLGFRPALSSTFYATMIGYLFNLAIPRLGEITRCGALSRRAKIPIQHLFGTILVERGLDLLTLFLIMLGTILFQTELLSAFLQEHLAGPLWKKASGKSHLLPVLATGAVAGVVLLWLLARFMGRKIKRRGGPVFFKIKRLIVGFLSGLKTFMTMRRKGLFVMHTLLIWLCYFLMVYVCFFSLDSTAHLGLMAGLTILTMGSLGIVAPVPGGVGTYHFIVALTLTEIYLVPGESAVSFAYLVHTSQTLVIVLVGLISLFLIARTGSPIKRHG